jgi:phage terminase large subunit
MLLLNDFDAVIIGSPDNGDSQLIESPSIIPNEDTGVVYFEGSIEFYSSEGTIRYVPKGTREKPYKLPEKFLPFFERNKKIRYKVAHGGRGTAKSEYTAEAAIEWARSEKADIVYAREFLASIKKSSHKLVTRKIIDLGYEHEFKITDQSITHKRTGSEITFIGLSRNADSIKSMDGAKLVIIEEGAGISMDSWEILDPTIRLNNSEIWIIWNPVYDTDTPDVLFRNPAVPMDMSYVVKVTQADNPYWNETPLKKQADEMWKKDPIKASWVWGGEYKRISEGRIYTNWELKVCEVPETAKVYFGIDWGGGANAYNVLLKGYSLFDGTAIYIEDEVFHRGDIESFMRKCLNVERIMGNEIKCDWASPSSIEYFRNRGQLNARKAQKLHGSVDFGISFLKSIKVYVNPKCVKLWKESQLYAWKTDRDTGQFIDIPEDKNNDGMDALRYLAEPIANKKRSVKVHGL